MRSKEMFAYHTFCLALFLWTCCSVKYNSAIPLIGYLVGMILMSVGVSMICVWSKKCRGRPESVGIIIFAVLVNLGMSVNYRCTKAEKITWNSTYLVDLTLMIAVFAVMYLGVRYTKIYRFHIFNFMVSIILPVTIFGARLSGRKTGGSYLYFAGFMIFGLVLLGFPFVAAWFMSLEENKYWRGKVGNISWNLLGFLGYTFLIYIGCGMCNEFGLLLIVGLTATVLFWIRCKDTKLKILYTVLCISGALMATSNISHLRGRVQIWLNPAEAFYNTNLKEKAESVLYLFRNFESMGWWSRGIGNLSKRIYPTLNTDHVLILLMNDYSVLLAVLVMILGIVFVRWMLILPKNVCAYDKYLNMTSALIVCFIMLIDISSNLGSFITAGIGFPWISDGSSVNIMLTGLMAVHIGLLRKGGEENG